MSQSADHTLHFKSCWLNVRNPSTWHHKTAACSSFGTGQDSFKQQRHKHSQLQEFGFISFTASWFLPRIHLGHFLGGFWNLFDQTGKLGGLKRHHLSIVSISSVSESAFCVRAFIRTLHLSTYAYSGKAKLQSHSGVTFAPERVSVPASEEGKSSIVRQKFTQYSNIYWGVCLLKLRPFAF